jgi:hypothetical protein
MKGRWEAVRNPTSVELKQTMVLAVPVKEASAKLRTGMPKDSQDDMDFPVWAGVVPLQIQAGLPITDEGCKLIAPNKMKYKYNYMED